MYKQIDSLIQKNFGPNESLWNPKCFDRLFVLLGDQKLLAVCTLQWADNGYWILGDLCTAEHGKGYGSLIVQSVCEKIKEPVWSDATHPACEKILLHNGFQRVIHLGPWKPEGMSYFKGFPRVYTMGWGICFGLDENYRLYCRDGCRWRTTDADYQGFVEWPSARLQVLEYYERDAHSELDMIRDECPGTAAALAAACPDYLGSAFHSYERLSDNEKIQLHENCMNEFQTELDSVNQSLTEAKANLVQTENEFKAFKSRNCRTRVDQIEEDIRRLQAELPYQKVLAEVKFLKQRKMRLVRLLRQEQKFSTH